MIWQPSVVSPWSAEHDPLVSFSWLSLGPVPVVSSENTHHVASHSYCKIIVVIQINDLTTILVNDYITESQFILFVIMLSLPGIGSIF